MSESILFVFMHLLEYRIEAIDGILCNQQTTNSIKLQEDLHGVRTQTLPTLTFHDSLLSELREDGYSEVVWRGSVPHSWLSTFVYTSTTLLISFFIFLTSFIFSFSFL
jgi:hypothetical protein